MIKIVWGLKLDFILKFVPVKSKYKAGNFQIPKYFVQENEDLKIENMNGMPMILFQEYGRGMNYFINYDYFLVLTLRK